MEFMQDTFDALRTGAEYLLTLLVALAGSYGAYLIVRLRSALLTNVPVWLHAFVAGAAEEYLQPIIDNAVRQAEEWAQRQIDEGLAKAQTLGAEKFALAKAYILRAAPDVVISDERLGALIDAALVRVGLGAAGAIRLGVEVVGEEIEKLQPPTQAEPPAA